MSSWEREIFAEVIIDGHFEITNPGPLHAPVRTFSIARDDKLKLVLETKAPTDAKSDAIEHPRGTLRTPGDSGSAPYACRIISRAENQTLYPTPTSARSAAAMPA